MPRYKIHRDSLHQEPFSYSETAPYSHLGNMFTSLLRPLSFSCLKRTAIHFLVKKSSLIQPFFWHIGDRIDGVPLYFNIVPSLARSLRSSSLRGISFHALVLCSKPPPLTFMIARIGLATRLLKSQILVNN